MDVVESVGKPCRVAITYNPFQGLKHTEFLLVTLKILVAITYNPFQGLKRNNFVFRLNFLTVAITYNPFQGLKLVRRN